MSDETTGTTLATGPSSVPVVSTPDQPVQTNGSASPPVDEMELALQQMPPLDEIEVPGGEPEPRRGSRGSRKSDDNELRTGQVVKGTVVHIDSEGVLVDVGMKSEGLIRPNELSREPVQNMEDVVKVGDQIDVLVLEPEGRDGNLLLSKKRADFERAWDRVQEALGDGRTIQGFVNDRVKGGLVVDLGIRGFVPASHVGNGKLKNLDKFVGQTIPLKVLEVDRQNRKVVLSHRQATEEEREKEKQSTINSLSEGQIRTGTIRRVTDYGAFVDLGGIDGLLHVSEMRWTRVKHPSDVVKVGDQVQVMILKLNLDQGRVSLGMRQILPDPWEEAAAKFSVGDTVEGEVTRLVPFGAFVELGGIEGIIPNSELSYKRISKPGDVVEQGQMVQVKVIDIRPDERRLTLSLKALQPREASDDYRSNRGPASPSAPPTEEGQAPAPGAGPARRPEKRDRRRGRDDEEGGDFRQYMGARDGGGGSGFTIGDILGDMFTDRSAGKATSKRAGGRRRRDEDEEEDLSNIDFDAEETAEVTETTEPPAEEA